MMKQSEWVPKQSEWVKQDVQSMCLIFSFDLIIFTFEPLQVLQAADHTERQQQRRPGSSSGSLSTPSQRSGTGSSTPASSVSTSSRNSSLSTQSSRRSLTMANPRTTAAATRAAQSGEQFQQGLDGVQAAKNGEKRIEITLAKLNELKKQAAASNKLLKELAAEQKKSEELENYCKDYEEKAASDAVAHQVLTDTIAKKDKLIGELKLVIANLQGALNKNGTVHESQLNRDLRDQTRYAAKVFLFRNVKFFEDDEDALEKTKMVVPYLPKGLASLGELTVDEYAKLYKQTANEGIQAAKQSVQAEGKKAAGGTYNFLCC